MSSLITQELLRGELSAAEQLFGGPFGKLDARLVAPARTAYQDPAARKAMNVALSSARRSIDPIQIRAMLKDFTRFAKTGQRIFVWAKRFGGEPDVAQDFFDAVKGHEDAVRWLIRRSASGWNTYISSAVFHPWATQRLNSAFHHTAVVYTDCDDAEASQDALKLHEGLGIPSTFYNVTGASVLDLHVSGQPNLTPSGGLALKDDKRIHTYHALSAPFPALEYWDDLPARPHRDDEPAIAHHDALVDAKLAPISARLHAAKALVGGIDLGDDGRPASEITDISTIDEARVLRCAGAAAWPLSKAHRLPEIPYRVELSGRRYTIDEIRAADPQRFDRLEAWYTENRGTTGGGGRRANLDRKSGPAREDINVVIEAALQAAQIKLAERDVGDRNAGFVWFGRTIGTACPDLICVDAVVDAAGEASPLGPTSDMARQVENGIAMAQGNKELRGFDLDHPQVETIVEVYTGPLRPTAVNTVVNTAERFVSERPEYALGAFYLAAYWFGCLIGGKALHPETARVVLHVVAQLGGLGEDYTKKQIRAVIDFQLYEGAHRPRTVDEIVEHVRTERAKRAFARVKFNGDRTTTTSTLKGSPDDYENF